MKSIVIILLVVTNQAYPLSFMSRTVFKSTHPIPRSLEDSITEEVPSNLMPSGIEEESMTKEQMAPTSDLRTQINKATLDFTDDISAIAKKVELYRTNAAAAKLASIQSNAQSIFTGAAYQKYSITQPAITSYNQNTRRLLEEKNAIEAPESWKDEKEGNLPEKTKEESNQKKDVKDIVQDGLADAKIESAYAMDKNEIEKIGKLAFI